MGIATDHGGFELNEDLKSYLRHGRHVVVVIGARELDPGDAARPVAAGMVDGGRVVGPLAAGDLVEVFLAASFAGEGRRIRGPERVAAPEAAQRAAEEIPLRAGLCGRSRRGTSGQAISS